MATATSAKAATWAALLVLIGITALMAGATVAYAQVDQQYTGVRVQIDNDLFAGRELDRDYTGGLSIAVSGTAAKDGMLSLDPVLARIDALGAQQGGELHYTRQIGLMAFTPGDTLAQQPLHDDRPYASLLFVSNGRMRVDADNRGAWSSSLSIGVLGLSLSERLHRAIHEVVGSEKPRGYAHQISAGGEPTARYTLARHALWIANANGTIDVKTTMQGSVGYLTEASAAISMRAGRFDSPWWSFAPELTDYIAAPAPAIAGSAQDEMYVMLGARLKARAYNAFLQGQFRDSVVRYSASDLQPLLVEAWIGFVMQLFDHTQLAYSLNYQTAELRAGEADREALWGAVQVTHTF